MDKFLVVNSSPIITLSKSKLLFLLLDHKEKLIIPEDVLNEVLRTSSDEVHSDQNALSSCLYSGYSVSSEILGWGLGKGESSVIASGQSLKNSILVIDDLQARKCARLKNLNIIGTLGLVIASKKEGKIESAKDAVTQLILSGLYLNQNLVQRILKENVNESWEFI